VVVPLLGFVIQMQAKLHYEFLEAQVAQVQQVIVLAMLLIDKSEQGLQLLFLDVFYLVVAHHLYNLGQINLLFGLESC